MQGITLTIYFYLSMITLSLPSTSNNFGKCYSYKWFYNIFYKLLMWWMIINKWKNNVNDEPRWEPRIIDHINSF